MPGNKAITSPLSKSDVMREHTLTSKQLLKGRHAFVVMDGAGWYQQHTLEGGDM